MMLFVLFTTRVAEKPERWASWRFLDNSINTQRLATTRTVVLRIWY